MPQASTNIHKPCSDPIPVNQETHAPKRPDHLSSAFRADQMWQGPHGTAWDRMGPHGTAWDRRGWMWGNSVLGSIAYRQHAAHHGHGPGPTHFLGWWVCDCENLWRLGLQWPALMWRQAFTTRFSLYTRPQMTEARPGMSWNVVPSESSRTRRSRSALTSLWAKITAEG